MVGRGFFYKPDNFEQCLELLASNHPKLFNVFLTKALNNLEQPGSPFLAAYLGFEDIGYDRYSFPKLTASLTFYVTLALLCTIDIPIIIFLFLQSQFYIITLIYQNLKGDLGNIYQDPSKDIQIEENSGMLYVIDEETSTKKYLAGPSGDPIIAFGSGRTTKLIEHDNGTEEIRIIQDAAEKKDRWYFFVFDTTLPCKDNFFSEVFYLRGVLGPPELDTCREALRYSMKLSINFLTTPHLAIIGTIIATILAKIFDKENELTGLIFVNETKFVKFSAERHKEIVSNITKAAKASEIIQQIENTSQALDSPEEKIARAEEERKEKIRAKVEKRAAELRAEEQQTNSEIDEVVADNNRPKIAEPNKQIVLRRR